MTWNIQMLPNSLALFSKALQKKQALREPWIVEHCIKNHYDVIVFQEVFDVNIKRKLKKTLAKAYPYQIDTRIEKGRLTSNGIFIVGRIPLRYIDHVIYKKGPHEDAWAAKGCTLVEAEKNGIKFQIAGTHLQAGRSEAAIRHRASQYKEIRTLLDRNKIDSQAIFMMGDMNTRKADKPTYNLMLKTIGVEDFPLNDPRPYTIDSTNSWNEEETNVQLDYIMLQKRNTKTSIGLQKILLPTYIHKGKTIDLADHYGIIADITVTN